jgi:hypothetical protein
MTFLNDLLPAGAALVEKGATSEELEQVNKVAEEKHEESNHEVEAVGVGAS